MISKFSLLALASFFIISPLNSMALAAVDMAGADALKTTLTRKISAQQNLQSARGDKLTFTGDVQVAPKDNYYAVTLPALKARDAKGQTLDIGKIAMNMAPTDNAEQFKTSLSLPSSVNILDGTNQTIGRIKIGSQKASGLLDMSVFNFTQLNASYDNISYEDLIEKKGVALNAVNLNYAMSRNGDAYSGPLTLKTGPVSLQSAGNIVQLADKIDAKGTAQINNGTEKSFTQSSDADITGLNKAITALNKRMQSPSETNKPMLQQTLGILSLIQLSGKMTPAGGDTRSYNILTTANGKTMLNGVDISLLLGK